MWTPHLGNMVFYLLWNAHCNEQKTWLSPVSIEQARPDLPIVQFLRDGTALAYVSESQTALQLSLTHEILRKALPRFLWRHASMNWGL